MPPTLNRWCHEANPTTNLVRSDEVKARMNPSTWTVLAFVLDWVIRIGLSIRVIMRRRSVGVTMAWLTLLLSVPFLGAIVYLFFGELRLGRGRAERAARLHGPYQSWLKGLGTRYPVVEDDSITAPQLVRLIRNGTDIPPLPGNRLELIDHFEEFFRRLIADIDAARRTCHLEFYIWTAGGLAEGVVDALIRAASRGVICRVLVDALGSRPFLSSPSAARLRQGGVVLRSALDVGLVRMLFVRADLRLHRKIVVIDGEIAYTGSQNLVDPRYFKQDAGVGEWVDAMVRVQGPAVEALGVTFLEDWELETGEGLNALADSHDLHHLAEDGSSIVQVLPSGPNAFGEGMQMVLLTAMYAAQRELVLTTPYFVPDESMLHALASAALRGVAVTLILPAKNDSVLVDLSSRSFQGDLAEAGVRIMLFHDGLLHTKSITVDGGLSLFGSLNLDPRSLQLNFEITLAIYDSAFTANLRALQQSYIDRSTALDLDAWKSRSAPSASSRTPLDYSDRCSDERRWHFLWWQQMPYDEQHGIGARANLEPTSPGSCLLSRWLARSLMMEEE